MKTAIYSTAYKARNRIPYPNAMTRKEMLHKILDTLIVAASGMGLAASLLLLMTLA